MKLFNSLLFSFIALTGQLLGDAATDAVQQYWDFPFSNSVVYTKPFLDNLFEFEDFFSDPLLPNQKGFVDINGLYVISASKIETDHKYILHLRNTLTSLPPFFNINNLQAFVGKTKFSPFKQVVYIDMDNHYAVIGGAVGPQFNFYSNVNFMVADAFIPNDQADFLYSIRNTLGSFLTGSTKAPKTIYVMGEPNCPFCNMLYTETKPFVDAGELSIHWFLTYFINETSQGKCWAILDGRVPKGAHYPHTPEGAFNYNEDNFGPGDNGGIPPITNPSFEANTSVNRNEQFLVDFSPFGTPFIIYKNAQGQPAYSNGGPSDINAFIDSIYVNPHH